MNEWLKNIGGMIRTGENQSTEKNLFHCHLFTPEILHGLADKQTEVSVVKGWRLTA
jgi:hypothetical protein